MSVALNCGFGASNAWKARVQFVIGRMMASYVNVAP